MNAKCVYIYPTVHIWSSSNQNIKTPSILVVNASLKAMELWRGGEGGVDIPVNYDNPNDLKHEIENEEPCNYKSLIDEKSNHKPFKND